MGQLCPADTVNTQVNSRLSGSLAKKFVNVGYLRFIILFFLLLFAF